MHITITDGFTLLQDDLNWAALEQFRKLQVHDRMSNGQIVEHCREAEIVVTNKVPFSRETIQQLPKLKLIAVTATGYNIIDTVAAREKNIVVCNVPGYGSASVAQHTFALLLELTNHVGLNSHSTSNGEWQKAADWCYTKKPIMELDGKILGIIGMGSIGASVATIARSLGMKLLFYNPSKKDIPDAQQVSLEEIFVHSDVLSLHCPLKPDNKEFVNGKRLETMKSTAFLINTSRGGLIHEQDLANALNNGRIAGAALDVLSTEPPSNNNPLLKAKNCIITPHNAWMSREARQRLLDVVISNIRAFLDGRAENVVN